ncbi:hypothetical protein TNCV_4994541 [Trichonephila clavipes]|nr:hypothetical protein TNCV_4994541 [Trichonephila clavipes]
MSSCPSAQRVEDLMIIKSVVTHSFPVCGVWKSRVPSELAQVIPDELTLCALEKVELKYPANEWFIIYTDGPYLPEINEGGTGMVLTAVRKSTGRGKETKPITMSEANPQVYVETPLHPEKLTVCGALWAGGILLQKR